MVRLTCCLCVQNTFMKPGLAMSLINICLDFFFSFGYFSGKRNNSVFFNCVSFPSAESFSGKGKYLKRIRYHGRGMFGIMDKVYCHYFVKLVEGVPPKPEQSTSFDQAKEYVQSLKNRTIIHSLQNTVLFLCRLIFVNNLK